MNTQANTKTTSTSSIFSLPVYISTPKTSLSAKEIGYEIDKDEMGSEVLAQLPASVKDQPAPQVDPDDFETLYKWFLS
jgi:hypothetical protein